MKQRIHDLKTDPDVYQDVHTGAKTHEIRLNDRDYQVGDILHLHETKYTGEQMRSSIVAPCPLEYTGRSLRRKVTHVLTGYGLQDRWCILSLEKAPTKGAYNFARFDVGNDRDGDKYEDADAEGEWVKAQDAIDRDMGRDAERDTMKAQHQTALINAFDDGVKRCMESYNATTPGDPYHTVLCALCELIKSDTLRARMAEWVEDMCAAS